MTVDDWLILLGGVAARVVVSPLECMRGGAIFFSQARMAQQTPEQGAPAPAYFAKIYGKMEGDGSDIVQSWLAEQRARAKRLEPQIK
jgi:hypothetical protein